MLKHKALSNLKAGAILAAAGLQDPATSRYYYALFQASVHGLTKRGLAPGGLRSGALQWDHSMVQSNVSFVRGRRADAVVYQAMRKLRERADYAGEVVEPGELAAHAADVRDFVEEVAG